MDKPVIYNLFVYGSLRKGFHSPAYEYISNFFEYAGEAKVKGFLVDLGDYPAATPTDSDNFIIGEIYKLKNATEYGWAMAQLDDYEGLNTEEGEIPMYRRESVTVYSGDNITTAWVYWYNGDLTGKPVIASGDIFQYIKDKQNG